MKDKNLQKEILKFISTKEKEPEHKKGEIVNDISVEFKNRNYSQEIINENLYSLAKNGKIGSGKTLDDENHRVYSPLFILEAGREQLKPWWQKNIVVLIATIAAVIAAIFSVLAYFKLCN